MEKLLVINDGIGITIARLNANNEVISRKNKLIFARLVDDNHIVDRKTISEVCGITEKAFTSEYDLERYETERSNGSMKLVNALFVRRSEQDIKAKLEAMRAKDEATIAKLEAMMDAKRKAKEQATNDKIEK